MKKIKVQVLFIIALFSVSPMWAMLSRAAQVPKRVQVSSTHVVQPTRWQRFMSWVSGGTYPLRTQTWGELFSSWWSGSAQPKVSISVTKPYRSPFVLQKREYKTSAAQSSSQSFTPQVFWEEFSKMLYPSNLQENFGLNSAEVEAINSFLSRNIKFIHANGLGSAVISGILMQAYKTILSNVENPSFFEKKMSTERYRYLSIDGYYIQLLQSQYQLGVKLNSATQQLLVNKFLNELMPIYEKLYNNYFVRTDIIHAYKPSQMFTLYLALESLVKYLIDLQLDEGLKNKLEVAFKQLNSFARRLSYLQDRDQKNREKFISTTKRKGYAWYSSWPSKDEKEYESWLKINDPDFFAETRRGTSFEGTGTKPGDLGISEQKNDLIKLLGVSPSASEEEIKKALTAYRKLNHPDLTPHNLSPQEREKEKKHRTEAIAHANDLFDKYLEKEKQQLATE